MLDDSKRLSPTRRELAFQAVRDNCLAWAVAVVGPPEIDRRGIGAACLSAMMRAVDALSVRPSHLLLDYIPVRQCPYPYDAVVKGDGHSYSIAAASNVAKVTRDQIMGELDTEFPGYGFARNKGYGTRMHLERLREIGPCEVHRRSFRPVAQGWLPLSQGATR